MKDILIVGRGLAGATLSFELINRGIPHEIIDSPTLSSSSKVAGGLINPLVLKRLKMVQDAEEFMPPLSGFYRTLEQLTASSFFHETTIHHIFASQGEVNLWEEKKDMPFYAQHLKHVKSNPHTSINAPFGIGEMQGVSWLNTNIYLDAHHKYCSAKNVSIHERQITEQEVQELSQQGKTVILCNGHLLKDWSYMPREVFTPTRGEVLTIEAHDLPTNQIIHSAIFTIPLGNHRFKVGATYHWDNLQDVTTEDALNKLKTDLEKIYSGPYTVVGHSAGVRPNVKDRKPLLGKLNTNLYIFNGMGSRAALMTPQLSSLMVDYLLKNEPIPARYDINRFL